MKPISNISKVIFGIGDQVPNRGIIEGTTPCPSWSICKDRYINSSVCGGFEQIINSHSCCLFFIDQRITEEGREINYLTATPEGECL